MIYKTLLNSLVAQRCLITFRAMAATVCLLGYLSAANAAAYESADRLLTAAHDFVTSQLGNKHTEVNFAQIDPRLRLQKCKGQLSAFWPSSSAKAGRTTIGVRCNGANPWKIYLPVTIKQKRQVTVTTLPLPRNHVVRAQDLKSEWREVSANTQFYADPKDVVGMIVRRPLSQGTVMSAAMLAPPKLVRRGQKVMIVAQSGSLSIRAQGVALMDGHEGQTVRVKNANSRRDVQAVVVGKNTVKVVM
jgi:flagella basal body P-ring formation protein FlgA